MKKKLIDIESEFEGLEDFFDEKVIKNRTASIELWKSSNHINKRQSSHSQAMKRPEVRKKFQAAIRRNESINSPESVAKRKQKKIEMGLIHDEKFWEEIYLQFWDKNRNDKDFKKEICKKYSIKASTLHTLINGAVGMNLPQELKQSHQERLDAWHKKFGNKRTIYQIVKPNGKSYVFDSLVEAGKWFCKETNKIVEPNKQGRVNYGNTVYGYFKLNIPKIKKGKFKDWQFLSINRN